MAKKTTKGDARRGRPPVNDPAMDKRNQIRSYPEDRAAWDQFAAADGRTFSEWARRTLNDASGRAWANRRGVRTSS